MTTSAMSDGATRPPETEVGGSLAHGCVTQPRAPSSSRSIPELPREDAGGRFGHLTDAELLLEAASDPVAFDPIFRRHVRPLRRYLARCVDETILDDLVAETFAVAFAQRRRYRSEYPDARPWLFGIAANLVREHRRRDRARLRAYARVGAQPVSHADGPDVLALARADAHAVRGELASALAVLRPGDRDTLLLMASGDLSSDLRACRARSHVVDFHTMTVKTSRRCDESEPIVADRDDPRVPR